MIQPLNKQVALRAIQQENKSAGGIVLTVPSGDIPKAVVVALPKDTSKLDGVSVGDVVFWRGPTTPFEHGVFLIDKEYLLGKYED